MAKQRRENMSRKALTRAVRRPDQHCCKVTPKDGATLCWTPYSSHSGYSGLGTGEIKLHHRARGGYVIASQKRACFLQIKGPR